MSSSSSSSSSTSDHRGGGAAAATAYSTPPVLIAFVLVLLVVCFVCFTLIYFCRCYFVSIIHTLAFHRSPSATATANSINNGPNSPFMGLDASLLDEFPTFPYSSVKDLRKEKKYGLECAICLLEFEDDSVLRLLTVCRHVFHQECVDLWLHRHKTCPVCRTDLETRKSSSSASSNIHDHERQSVAAGGEDGNADDVCIDVKEGGDEDDDGINRFLRSHSTGHSIVMVREEGRDDDDDRYRLRLQEDAELRIVKSDLKKKNNHKYSRSCESYTEMMMTMMMAAKPLVPPCTNCGYVDHQTLSSSACSSRLGAAN